MVIDDLVDPKTKIAPTHRGEVAGFQRCQLAAECGVRARPNRWVGSNLRCYSPQLPAASQIKADASHSSLKWYNRSRFARHPVGLFVHRRRTGGKFRPYPRYNPKILTEHQQSCFPDVSSTGSGSFLKLSASKQRTDSTFERLNQVQMRRWLQSGAGSTRIPCFFHDVSREMATRRAADRDRMDDSLNPAHHL